MSKKIKFPAILIAHDLKSGQVIYWSGNEWEDNFHGAKIANDDESANELDEIAQKFINQNQVVVDYESHSHSHNHSQYKKDYHYLI